MIQVKERRVGKDKNLKAVRLGACFFSRFFPSSFPEQKKILGLPVGTAKILMIIILNKEKLLAGRV
jgi:hypothetical protein